MGDCTNREDKKVGDCNDADTNDVMGDNYYIYLSLEMSIDLEQVVVEQLLTELVTYLLHALLVGTIILPNNAHNISGHTNNINNTSAASISIRVLQCMTSSRYD